MTVKLLSSSSLSYLEWDTCLFPVDTIAPRIISCPSQESTIVTIELGEPGVMVTWQEPMVSDLSEVVLVSQSHMSNQFFVVGPTTVTYVYRDSSNNMANCQFVVSVQTGWYHSLCILRYCTISLLVPKCCLSFLLYGTHIIYLYYMLVIYSYVVFS